MFVTRTAVLTTAAALSVRLLSASTTFNAAYLTPASGPAGGGTALAVVGNQFQSGATVTIGGADAGGSVTSSTRIGATAPSRTAGAVYDVVVTNGGGGPASVLPRAWFADFADVAPSSPFHAPIEQMVRDGITSLRQAYTRDEAGALARSASPTGNAVDVFPFGMLVTGGR